MDLNKTMIIGRLTRDPEVRTTPQGTSVASFSLATNFIWTDSNGAKQEKVEFHNIVAWRKLAEICAQYLKKGGKVYIEGRLQTRDWEGQDGVKRYRTEIVAENMIMLDRAPSSGGSQFTPSTPSYDQPPVQEEQSAPAGTEIPQADASAAPGSDDEIKVENIPF